MSVIGAASARWIAVLLLSPLSVVASAVEPSDCFKRGLEAQLQILACSAVIAKPDESKKTLGLAYSVRGFAHAKVGLHRLALSDFNSAVALRAEPSDYYNRGLSYYLIGDLDSALADFTYALTKDPLMADAMYNMGLIELAKGERHQAIKHFDRAIRTDQMHADSYLNRGVAYAELGFLDRAMSDFDQAIRIQPTDPKLFVNRGAVHELTGSRERAIQDYRRALSLDPSFAPALSALKRMAGKER
jgi:tetratricopeptide (TPR) repeat protein